MRDQEGIVSDQQKAMLENQNVVELDQIELQNNETNVQVDMEVDQKQIQNEEISPDEISIELQPVAKPLPDIPSPKYEEDKAQSEPAQNNSGSNMSVDALNQSDIKDPLPEFVPPTYQKGSIEDYISTLLFKLSDEQIERYELRQEVMRTLEQNKKKFWRHSKPKKEQNSRKAWNVIKQVRFDELFNY